MHALGFLAQCAPHRPPQRGLRQSTPSAADGIGRTGRDRSGGKGSYARARGRAAYGAGLSSPSRDFSESASGRRDPHRRTRRPLRGMVGRPPAAPRRGVRGWVLRATALREGRPTPSLASTVCVVRRCTGVWCFPGRVDVVRVRDRTPPVGRPARMCAGMAFSHLQLLRFLGACPLSPRWVSARGAVVVGRAGWDERAATASPPEATRTAWHCTVHSGR